MEKDINGIKIRESFTHKALYEQDTRIQYLEQMLLEPNLILSNVIQCANEDPTDLATRIILKTGCQFTDLNHQILGAFRLKPKKTTETPPLLVKLASTGIKRAIMTSLKTNNIVIFCDQVGLSIHQQIYFNHHLTPTNQQLLGKVRSIKKQQDFHGAFYANGYIWVKKIEHSTPIRITCENDLKNLR